MKISIGAQLKAAREAKGLTASELAASINTLTRVIQNLENDDFRRMPAPVYVRGFIKLYAQAVGLDPTPLVEEYAAIQARAPGSQPQTAPLAGKLTHDRQKPAIREPAPTTPAMPGAEQPPAGKRPRRLPSIAIPKLRLPQIRLPRLRLPAIRIPTAVWQGIGMAAGVGVVALLLVMGVREIANRRSMAVSRDLRLVKDPPAPYLAIPSPATPHAGQ